MTASFRVEPSAEAVAETAADVVAGIVREQPTAVIGFATGSTPLPLYSALASRVRRGELDLSGTTAVGLDEYVGITESDPRSFAAYLRRHVLGPFGIPRERAALLDGSPAAHDVLERRCVEHERAITSAGGLDLLIAGIGRNGHLAFNEPGTPFDSRTRVAVLAEGTRAANAEAFAPHPVPAASITIGLATIAEARTILLVATGDDKADAVAAAFDGPVDPSCPGSLLQRHPDVRAVLDPTAASSLSRRGRGAPSVLETHA